MHDWRTGTMKRQWVASKYSYQPHHHPKAFTLVELLVVIAIIGVLVGLLLPAVQAARESARRSSCRNKLKQLSLGCINHESTKQQYPGGGWGFGWTGDADRGSLRRQPSGWIYNVLPYIEEESLHDKGSGTTGTGKMAANLERIATPISSLYCPSRRSASAYPWQQGWSLVNANQPTVAGRSDYAGNAGSVYVSPSSPIAPSWPTATPGADAGPASLADGDSATGHMDQVATVATGIFFYGSLTKLADITDGTTSTILIGEKYLAPQNYTTGRDGGDDQGALVGANKDICRWSRAPGSNAIQTPKQDVSTSTNHFRFGSAHAGSFHAAFCDGSVRTLAYEIDEILFENLVNRRDGAIISAGEL